MHFADAVQERIQETGSILVMGMDPRPSRLPSSILQDPDLDEIQHPGEWVEPVETFCDALLDIASGNLPAVKVQAAFFEQLGPEGIELMRNLLERARERHLVVILDAKRSDIGSTAAAYSRSYLGSTGDSEEGTGLAPDLESPFYADALTVNPYFGTDGLEPFFQAARKQQKGLFPLVKTSNPGAKDLQELEAGEEPVYLHVARMVKRLSRGMEGECGYSSAGAVVGATQANALKEIRQILPEHILLTPGIGAQGGTLQTLSGLVDQSGMGCLVPVARSLIYAYQNDKEEDWKDSVRKKMDLLNENLNDIL